MGSVIVEYTTWREMSPEYRAKAVEYGVFKDCCICGAKTVARFHYGEAAGATQHHKKYDCGKELQEILSRRRRWRILGTWLGQIYKGNEKI